MEQALDSTAQDTNPTRYFGKDNDTTADIESSEDKHSQRASLSTSNSTHSPLTLSGTPVHLSHGDDQSADMPWSNDTLAFQPTDSHSLHATDSATNDDAHSALHAATASYEEEDTWPTLNNTITSDIPPHEFLQHETTALNLDTLTLETCNHWEDQAHEASDSASDAHANPPDASLDLLESSTHMPSIHIEPCVTERQDNERSSQTSSVNSHSSQEDTNDDTRVTHQDSQEHEAYMEPRQDDRQSASTSGRIEQESAVVTEETDNQNLPDNDGMRSTITSEIASSAREQEDQDLTDESDHTVSDPLPTQRVWEADHLAPSCRRCGRRFTFLLRRHHCRRCGQVVCDRCSDHRIKLPWNEIVLDPSVDTSVYTMVGNFPQRVCDACVRIPVKQIVGPSQPQGPTASLTVGSHMRRTGSSQSLMTECPVCGTGLLGMHKHEQERHLQQCLNSGSPPVRPPRYIVYELSSDSPQIGNECLICFEEFSPRDKVARMICLCSYHHHCLANWLERGKGCPVHYDPSISY